MLRKSNTKIDCKKFYIIQVSSNLHSSKTWLERRFKFLNTYFASVKAIPRKGTFHLKFSSS